MVSMAAMAVNGLVQQRARRCGLSAILCSLVALEGFLPAPVLRQPYRSAWDHSTVRGRSTCCTTPLAVSNPHHILQTLYSIHSLKAAGNNPVCVLYTIEV